MNEWSGPMLFAKLGPENESHEPTTTTTEPLPRPVRSNVVSRCLCWFVRMCPPTGSSMHRDGLLSPVRTWSRPHCHGHRCSSKQVSQCPIATAQNGMNPVLYINTTLLLKKKYCVLPSSQFLSCYVTKSKEFIKYLEDGGKFDVLPNWRKIFLTCIFAFRFNVWGYFC